jgi:hypothetical protein
LYGLPCAGYPIYPHQFEARVGHVTVDGRQEIHELAKQNGHVEPKQSAKNLLSRLSLVTSQLFRRLTAPAHPNVMTDTLADLPRTRVELLAENVLLWQQLIILGRTKTPRLTGRERLSLLFLAPCFPIGSKFCQ